MPKEIEIWGSMLSVADEGVDKLCKAAMSAWTNEYNTLEDLIEGDVIGTYFPPENLISASFAGEDYDISEGIFVAEMTSGSEYAGAKFDPYGEIMEALYYELWLDDPIVGRCVVVVDE